MNTLDHASPEELYSLHAGDLDEREARRIRVHLDTCERCDAESQLAARFARESSKPLPPKQAERLWEAVAPTPPRVRHRPWGRWASRGLLAATFVFAALGIREMLPRDESPDVPPALRGPRDAEWNLRARQVQTGLELTWGTQGESGIYRIAVQTVRGEELWRVQTGETRVVVPQAVLDDDAGETRVVGVTFTVDGVPRRSPLLVID